MKWPKALGKVDGVEPVLTKKQLGVGYKNENSVYQAIVRASPNIDMLDYELFALGVCGEIEKRWGAGS